MSIRITTAAGRVLYTAETAIDVKQALTEAVKSGADLGGAYLGGADLRGADLGGADLGGADLGGAYLRGADLGGADLGGAYLRDADLRDAYLGGADLGGAYLGGAYLRGADLGGADLGGADLRDADLRDADLGGADLRGADLRDADLRGAYLRDADLRGADLRGAYLRGAYLRGAEGVNLYLTTPLHILADQPGPIRAYKLVNERGEGPQFGGVVYEPDAVLEVSDADCDPDVSCGRGLNVATLDWCLREWRPGYRILLVEFTAADIACIPTGSDGKFRLHRLTVVGEKDLAELGLSGEVPS